MSPLASWPRRLWTWLDLNRLAVIVALGGVVIMAAMAVPWAVAGLLEDSVNESSSIDLIDKAEAELDGLALGYLLEPERYAEEVEAFDSGSCARARQALRDAESRASVRAAGYMSVPCFNSARAVGERVSSHYPWLFGAALAALVSGWFAWTRLRWPAVAVLALGLVACSLGSGNLATLWLTAWMLPAAMAMARVSEHGASSWERWIDDDDDDDAQEDDIAGS